MANSTPTNLLSPCPICGVIPKLSYWNHGTIIRCSGTEGDRHTQVGTGSWIPQRQAIDLWNKLVKQQLNPILEGEVYPCPICGCPPIVQAVPISGWEVKCYEGWRHDGHSVVFGEEHGRTRQDAIAAWNSAIEAIAKSLAAGVKSLEEESNVPINGEAVLLPGPMGSDEKQ